MVDALGGGSEHTHTHGHTHGTGTTNRAGRTGQLGHGSGDATADATATTTNNRTGSALDIPDNVSAQTLGVATTDPTKVAFNGKPGTTEQQAPVDMARIVDLAAQKLPSIPKASIQVALTFVFNEVDPRNLEFLLNSLKIVDPALVEKAMNEVMANPKIIASLKEMDVEHPENIPAQMRTLATELQASSSPNAAQVVQDMAAYAQDVGRQSNIQGELEEMGAGLEEIDSHIQAMAQADKDLDVPYYQASMAALNEQLEATKREPTQENINKLNKQIGDLNDDLDIEAMFGDPGLEQPVHQAQGAIDNLQLALARVSAQVNMRGSTVVVVANEQMKEIHELTECDNPEQRQQLMQQLGITEQNGAFIKDGKEYKSLEELHDGMQQTTLAASQETVNQGQASLGKMKTDLQAMDGQIATLTKKRDERNALLDQLKTASGSQKQEILDKLAAMQPPITVEVDPATQKTVYKMQTKEGTVRTFDSIDSLKASTSRYVNDLLATFITNKGELAQLVSKQQDAIDKQSKLLGTQSAVFELEQAVDNKDTAAYNKALEKIKAADPSLAARFPASLNPEDAAQLGAIHEKVHDAVGSLGNQVALAAFRLDTATAAADDKSKQIKQMLEHSDRNAMQRQQLDGNLANYKGITSNRRIDQIITKSLDGTASPREIQELESLGFKYDPATKKLTYSHYDPINHQDVTHTITSAAQAKELFKALISQTDLDIKVNADSSKLNHGEIEKYLAEHPDLEKSDPDTYRKLVEARDGEAHGSHETARERQDVKDSLTSDFIGMTDAEAEQVLAANDRAAAQIFYQEHGFYLSPEMQATAEGNGSSAVASGQTGGDAPPVNASVSFPSTTSTAAPAAASAVKEEETSMWTFARGLFNQVFSRTVSDDATTTEDQERTHTQQQVRTFQTEAKNRDQRLEKKRQQREEEKEELDALANEEADVRMKGAGLRQETLAEQTAADVTNRPRA